MSILNNWIVIVCSSRYFFNYRHLSNALTIYWLVRDMGIPDSHIVLMNSLDVACDSRNSIQGSLCSDMFINGTLNNEIYRKALFDYTGNEVNVNNFIKLLTSRYHNDYGFNKRLKTDRNSNIFLFMSGHGGDEFFKFQDQEELSAEDIGYVFTEMYYKGLYKEIIFMIDTCQASTLANYITAPNIITIASSKKGENSFSYVNSDEIGVSLIDRFTYSIQQFFNQYRLFHDEKHHTNNYLISNKVTFQDLINFMDFRFLRSTVTVTYSSPGTRQSHDIPLTDFFSANNIHNNSDNNNDDSFYDTIEIVDVVEV